MSINLFISVSLYRFISLPTIHQHSDNSQGALSFFSGNSQVFILSDNSQETLRLLGVCGCAYLFSAYAYLHFQGVT